MRQTRERIFRGNTRAEGKLVSVFEPSTGRSTNAAPGKSLQVANRFWIAWVVRGRHIV
jgi:hypothetical protein